MAEVKMALLIVHHNTFFRLSDDLTPYIQLEFKGSKAAENFSCHRTKTAAIVNCLGSHYQKELISDLRSTLFSIMLDGSNDTGLANMFPITVRVFDINFNRVMTKFLDMKVMEGKDVSIAAVMFKSVDDLFSKFDLHWEYVTSIGVNNKNSNIGRHNSIASRAKEINKKMIIAGCPCHVLHNAAGKAAEEFTKMSGFDFKDHCVYLFFWFDKSTKRKNTLKEYYEFCDSEYEDRLYSLVVFRAVHQQRT